MKNPNGYGSVFKLTGRRRKPYGVRITTGWSEEGKQQYRNIGYFKTRPEAILALAQFNKDPYTVEVSTVTFTEIYDKWSNEKFSKISNSNIAGYKAAFKHTESLHNIKFVEIKKSHLQSVIDSCDKSYSTHRKIKILFNQLFKYSLENDIVSKDYSKFVEIGLKTSESTKEPFTKEEIQVLWDNIDRMDYIDAILIMIYTGLRPGELVTIETKNIDIENRIMRGGIKTAAGKNRIIPINEKILPLIKKCVLAGNEYLIVNQKKEQIGYHNFYKDKWVKIMEQLKMNHKPHECRHTFATLMDNAGANKVCIKRIIGHSSKDITDKVYTHKDLEELRKAIDLI